MKVKENLDEAQRNTNARNRKLSTLTEQEILNNPGGIQDVEIDDEEVEDDCCEVVEDSNISDDEQEQNDKVPELKTIEGIKPPSSSPRSVRRRSNSETPLVIVKLC